MLDAILRAIGKALRTETDQITKQTLPDRLAALLSRLERKERTGEKARSQTDREGQPPRDSP